MDFFLSVRLEILLAWPDFSKVLFLNFEIVGLQNAFGVFFSKSCAESKETEYESKKSGDLAHIGPPVRRRLVRVDLFSQGT